MLAKGKRRAVEEPVDKASLQKQKKEVLDENEWWDKIGKMKMLGKRKPCL